MSKQLKTLEKLLFIILSNKDFLQREDLRVEFSKENKEFDEYFNKAYEILEESNFILKRKFNLNSLCKTSKGLLFQDELNHEFCDIYKITNESTIKDFVKIFAVTNESKVKNFVKFSAITNESKVKDFVKIFAITLSKYVKIKQLHNKYLKKEYGITMRSSSIEPGSNNFYNEYNIKYGRKKGSLEKTELKEIFNDAKTKERQFHEDMIKQLYILYIDKDVTINEIFDVSSIRYEENEEKNKELIRYLFIQILQHILWLNLTTISENVIKEKINQFLNDYYNHKLKAIKKSRKVIKTDPEKIQESAKNNMLKIIIEAFKALGIITDEFSESGSRIFNIIEIEDTQWKMNAKSKNVLISYLIKGFSSLNNISDEDKELIIKIFNFRGKF